MIYMLQLNKEPLLLLRLLVWTMWEYEEFLVRQCRGDISYEAVRYFSYHNVLGGMLVTMYINAAKKIDTLCYPSC